jgi:hypothetical protein
VFAFGYRSRPGQRQDSPVRCSSSQAARLVHARARSRVQESSPGLSFVVKRSSLNRSGGTPGHHCSSTRYRPPGNKASVPILRERGVMRNLRVEGQSRKPAPGQRHAQFLHQLALTGDAIQITDQPLTAMRFPLASASISSIAWHLA